MFTRAAAIEQKVEAKALPERDRGTHHRDRLGSLSQRCRRHARQLASALSRPTMGLNSHSQTTPAIENDTIVGMKKAAR